MRPRIVVTGMGVVSPLGCDPDRFFDGLVEGRSTVDYVRDFDTTGLPVKIASQVRDFDPLDYMDAKQARRCGRYVQFAVAAGTMAARHARLDMSREDPTRVGCIVATDGGLYGDANPSENHAGRAVDPFFLTKGTAHIGAAQLGRALGAKGPNTSNNSACASGNDAIGLAMNWLLLGHADVMLAGGSEAMITPFALTYLGRIGALSRRADDPAHTSRPFDAERDGFVLAEGAAIVVLETEEHAVARDAPILAELAGTGWSFDAFNDSAPAAEGQAAAIRAALRDARLSPTEIEYVNAHGTSTKLNDVTETRALHLALGEHARRVPVSSIKSVIGHAAAAAGALEMVACVQVLQRDIIPPTINYRVPDPECDLDYVPNEPRRQRVNVCLSNSFGLGGQNNCLIIRRYR